MSSFIIMFIMLLRVPDSLAPFTQRFLVQSSYTLIGHSKESLQRIKLRNWRRRDQESGTDQIETLEMNFSNKDKN